MLSNTQISAGLAGDGSGSLVVANGVSTTVDRTGGAVAGSGAAIAMTPGPGGTGDLSQLTALSGGAIATGVDSVNVVSNTSQALVQTGDNLGSVDVIASNRLSIVEQGVAISHSGASLVDPALTAPPALLASNASTGAGTPVTAVGLVATTTIASSATTSATVQPNSTATVGIHDVQGAIVANVGQAAAVSKDVCAGSGCVPAPATVAPLAPVPAVAGTPVPAGSGALVAESGSVAATGVEASNRVNTNASAVVRVGGENHGIIQVVIETVTQIVNYGVALVSSGAAAAGGAAVTGPGSEATSTTARAESAAASATGAEVSNDVDLSSSASVLVRGDNRSPIDIFLDLFAWIGNLGSSGAVSGNAQSGAPLSADGSAGGSLARTGAASATGLTARNSVNMNASAFVDIEGSNYADITVHIRFRTLIQNVGEAIALSGRASAAGATEQAGSLAGNPGPAAVSSRARGASAPSVISVASGDVTALGNTSTFVLSSGQYANANGTDPALPAIQPVTLAPVSRVGRPDVTARVTDPNLAGTIQVRSGDAFSSGWDSVTVASNLQASLCSNSGETQCVAVNEALYDEDTRSNSTALSGFAGVNATPTPIPAASPPADSSGSEGDDGGRSGTIRSTTVLRYTSTQVRGQLPRRVTGQRLKPPDGLSPFGYSIDVEPPVKWPEAEVPPMPGQKLAQKTQVLVSAPAIGGSQLSRGEAVKDKVNIDLWASQPDPAKPPLPSNPVTESMLPTNGSPGPGMPGLPLWLNFLLGGLAAIAGAATTRRGRAAMVTAGKQASATARALLAIMLPGRGVPATITTSRSWPVWLGLLLGAVAAVASFRAVRIRAGNVGRQALSVLRTLLTMLLGMIVR